MDYVRLGRTEAMVSVAGLGCGGHSRLGMASGASSAEASRIVAKALDLGVNFLDTARSYGTEEAVSLGIRGLDRSKLFISTKSWAGTDLSNRNPDPLPVADFVANLETSLRTLGTDYVDLWHLHGVSPSQLDHVYNELLPEMHRQRDLGKIRFIGITEAFREDLRHEVLQQALPTGEFDVAMVGFNLINPGARSTVFPLAIKHDVGTLIMFAVRRALGNRENAAEAVGKLIELGEVDPALVDPADPLGFLAAHPKIRSQIEAAYRFCRYEPGANVVLTGTGKEAHLEENIQSILAPPLPRETSERLARIFGSATSISGE
tara:strand:+ start:10751 stop:11707 length:957 start_codon:yes stop_codon:yes gene_type:complete